MLKTTLWTALNSILFKSPVYSRKFFSRCRRLVRDGFPYIFQVPDKALNSTRLFATSSLVRLRLPGELEAFGVTTFLQVQLGDSERARSFVGGK